MHRPNSTSTEAVKKWSSTGISSSEYATGELWVSEGKDEANAKTWVYTDKLGRTILKRQEGPGTTLLDTYYIYDGAGNVIFVIQPKGVEKMTSLGNFNVAAVPNMVFSYVYDQKNRVIEKKVPGASGAVLMIYDPLDRLVLMQDANMRAAGGYNWLYMKYDGGGRVIIQGMYTHASVLTRSQMQAHVNSQACYAANSTTYYEQRSPSTASYYTDVCFPINSGGNITEERQYNYYDDYNFDNDGLNTADYSYSPQGLPGEAIPTAITGGLPTGQKRRILGSNNWLISVSFYDRYYNVLQVKSNNQLNLSVNDHATTVTDFEGKAQYAKQYKTTGGVTLTVQSRYLYDVAGRLTELKQSNNAGTEYTVAKYEYNALGQLIDKKLHSTNGINFLQSIDYRYSIRGQLLSLNNAGRTVNAANNDDANDVFGMEWMYEQTDANIGNTASYTGTISAIKWSGTNPANATPDQKAFVYSYDKLYRISTAVYKARAQGGSGSFTKDMNGFNESFAYDVNGNITSLQRNSWINGAATQIDNLSYSYAGNNDNNRLAEVNDSQNTNAPGWGFRNFTNADGLYTYDDNGNLTEDPKKGITITYNDIDKPTEIWKSDPITVKKIEYTYDAAGVRLSKLVYNGSATTPEKRLDYIGGMVIENNGLSYFGMAEGRVRNDAGVLKPEYFITDALGNVRSVFEDNGGGSAVVRQQTDYYAFGMGISGAYNSGENDNKNLYNAGSEWQTDIEDGVADFYSTFFREYDAVVGRFVSVDPMAGATMSLSSYAFANNNPLLFNDPVGNTAREVNPATFRNARELLDYIEKHGISSLPYNYMYWSFAAEDESGGSAGGIASFAYGDEFRVGTNKSGVRGVWFSWTASYYDGYSSGFANASLNTFALGKTFLKAQTLWNTALQYGEQNRIINTTFMGQSQSVDVMWRHNYEVYKHRMQRGYAAQSSGDRASYDQQLPGFEAQYRREKSAREAEQIMLAGFATPFAAVGILQIGGALGIGAIYNTVSTTISEVSFEFGVSVFSWANNVRNTIGIGAATYFNPNSNTATRLINWGNGTFNPITAEGIMNFRDNYQTIQYFVPLMPNMP